MRRGCRPDLGTGTQQYSFFSEWEYTLCHYKLKILNLFLYFTRCDNQGIVFSVRRYFEHMSCLGCYTEYEYH